VSEDPRRPDGAEEAPDGGAEPWRRPRDTVPPDWSPRATRPPTGPPAEEIPGLGAPPPPGERVFDRTAGPAQPPPPSEPAPPPAPGYPPPTEPPWSSPVPPPGYGPPGDWRTDRGGEPGRLPVNVAAAIVYLFGFIGGGVMITVDPRPDVRFHAVQSMAFDVVAAAAGFVVTLLAFIPILSVLFWPLLLGYLLAKVLLVAHGLRGGRFKLPVIGDLAELQSARARG
jgi:uncharacterized membrane protein